MPRPLRAVIPDQVHHLVLRGNNDGAIFIGDPDRERFRDILRDAALTHRVAIHAYVLMDNRVHLLATPAEVTSLSRMVQGVGRSYVVWFNRKHERSGTLWGGRFKAHLVDAQAYLLLLMRFIESQPFRTRLAPALLETRWSSLAHHLGETRDPLITEHALFWGLGNTPFEREAAYRRWVEEGSSAAEERELEDACRSSRPLAKPRFLAEMQRLWALPLPPKSRGRPRKNSGTI
jgi:putative transposase